MKLSPRLEKILSFVPDGTKTLADVGTDHGFLSFECIKRELCDFVIATDISAQSLKKAERLFAENGVSNADFRCGDGFSVLKDGEAEVVVVAGMGGAEILGMLKNDVHPRRYVLSPQHDVIEVRKYLVSNGYKLLNDEIVFSENKYYNVIVAEVGKDELTEDELIFGRDNLAGRTQCFSAFLKSEKARTDKIIALNPNSEAALKPYTDKVDEILREYYDDN